MAICFIVGHGKSAKGGYDSGAVNGSYHEFKIAKEIAKYAAEYYNSTYAEKADLMNYNGDLYLTERISRANTKGYSFIAEIHLNAGGGTGSEAFYAKKSAKGKKIAAAISKKISVALGIKDRGAKTKSTSSGTDYFGIIRNTKAEAVLVESAFIDTTGDLNKLKTAEGQKKCGIAIAQGIAEARGIKKKVTAKIEVGDKVKLLSGATYYDGKKIPLWVKVMTLYVRSINGDRVVISTKRTGAVTGAVHKKYLKEV